MQEEEQQARPPVEDFRLSIDWGARDDGDIVAARPRGDSPSTPPTPGLDSRSSFVPAPTPIMLEDATLESVQAAVLSAATRVEELYSEINKLRLVTGDRLSDVTGAVSTVTAAAAEARDVIERMNAGLADVSDGQLQQRITELADEAVSRVRAAVQEAEVTLRDVVEPGRLAIATSQDELADRMEALLEEVKQVKRRLALRAKAPPAELSDEQLDHVIRSVTAAVTTALDERGIGKRRRR